MVPKLPDVTELLINPDNVELYIMDKLTRQSSYSQLKTLIGQLESIRGPGKSIEDFRLPDGFCLRPVEENEQRVEYDGEIYIVNTLTGDTVKICPYPILQLRPYTFVNTTDRGPTVACPLWFLTMSGYLTWPHFGFCHAQWNALKAAARKCKAGVVWRAVGLMVCVWNLNCGPYRSQCWYRQKQTMLARWLATNTPESQCFIDILDWHGELNGISDTTTESARRTLYGMLPGMKSFNQLGPTFKFMRWCSMKESHDFYKPELAASRLILHEMCNVAGDELAEQACAEARTASTEVNFDVDAEVESLRESLKRKGKVKVAHDAIRPAVVDLVDVFISASTFDQQLYGHRTALVKTPAAGVIFKINEVNGGWRDYFYGVARCSLLSMEAIRYTHSHESNPRGRKQAEVFADMVMWICRCRGEWIQTQVFAYPHCAVAALATDPVLRSESKAAMSADFQVLLQAESMQHMNDVFKNLVASVFWRNSELVRLLLHMLEAELALPEDQRPTPSPVDELLKATHCCWPDEKGAEDTHQHIRDEARTQRHPAVNSERIFGASYDANVARERGVPSLTVSPEALEGCRRREAPKTRDIYHGAPKVWPARLDRILNPEHQFDAPTVAGEVKGVSAWLWLKTYMTQFWPFGLVPVIAGGLSSLCSERHLLLHTLSGRTRIIVSSHPWHCLWWGVVEVAQNPEGESELFKLECDDISVDAGHVCSLSEYKMASCVGVFWEPEAAVVFRRTSRWDDLLPSALLQGTPIRKEVFEHICTEIGVVIPETAKTEKKRLEILLEFVFRDRPDDLAKATAAYFTPKTDDTEDDPELTAALAELCEDDPDNAQEFSALVTEQQGKRIKRLARALQEERNRRRLARGRGTGRGRGRGRGGGNRRGNGRGNDRGSATTAPPAHTTSDSESSDSDSSSSKASQPAACAIAERVPDAEGAAPIHEKGPRVVAAHDKKFKTPAFFKERLPEGIQIFLHSTACHWRIYRALDRTSQVFGFGPTLAMNFREAADAAVSFAWNLVVEARPAGAYWDDDQLEEAMGSELVDTLDERSQKRRRRM